MGYTRPVVGENWLKGHLIIKYNYSEKMSFKGITNYITLTKRATFPLYVVGVIKGKECLGKFLVIAWVMPHLEPGLLLDSEFLWGMSSLINYKDLTIKLGVCNDLIASVMIMNRNLRVICNIIVARKIVMPLRSWVMVPVECVAILKDGIYLFKGEFAGAEDAILDYANFVSIVNIINVARIIFARMKLGCLSNFED
jgi:hypothetical protein